MSSNTVPGNRPAARYLFGHRAHAPQRGPVLTALAIALATVGCAPPGPREESAAVEAMREQVYVGAPVDAQVSYLRSGDARGPRLILVHGTPGDATGWTDYLVDPPPGVEVVALDRPGFGRSGPSAAVTSLRAQAAAVTALLPADGRRAVLLGHSLGGPIVAWVAAEQAPRIAAVVLLAGSLDPAQERIHPMQYVGSWLPLRAMLPRAIRNANSELMALKPELVALGGMLDRITAKVVIMHGTRDDLVPFANVAYDVERLQGAVCVKTMVLDGRNHFLPWNSEAQVRDAIRVALEPVC